MHDVGLMVGVGSVEIKSMFAGVSRIPISPVCVVVVVTG